MGLHIALPLSADAFARVAAPLELGNMLPGALGAVVVGDGGPGFFSRFVASGGNDGGIHTLDRYTRRIVSDVVRGVVDPPIEHRIVHPFDDLPLPFQRLGAAAGIGPPGPLGIQIHPVYGPWWAYRALIVVTTTLADEAALGDACRGCDAPCVAACPGGAVRPDGFAYPACRSRRLQFAECRESCVARIRCIRGPEHRYPDAQLAFHMRASLPPQR